MHLFSKTGAETLCKKCPYSELFWSAFSRIRTKYGEILNPNAGKCWTRITPNTDTFHLVKVIKKGTSKMKVYYIVPLSDWLTEHPQIFKIKLYYFKERLSLRCNIILKLHYKFLLYI